LIGFVRNDFPQISQMTASSVFCFFGACIVAICFRREFRV
jgi:hypothetical protein